MVTSERGSAERDARLRLGRRMSAAGALAPDWRAAYEEVPRAAFLPPLMWPWDAEQRSHVPVSRSRDPATWYAYADSDAPIVTQWDDGDHTGLTPGRFATSTALGPSVVFGLLGDLRLSEGVGRVLEVGTGTGWTTALLAHRLSVPAVTSFEIDESVAALARQRLRRFGLTPEVRVGDGLSGYTVQAPYDRIVACCGLREVPYAWIEQSAPGALIVLPWGTHFCSADVLVALRVSQDGRSASGRFLRPLECTRARGQRWRLGARAEYLRETGAKAQRSSAWIGTDILDSDLLGSARFALGLRVPRCATAVAPTVQLDGSRPVWFHDTGGTGSWACLVLRPDAESTVLQYGERKLWHEVEAAYRWWQSAGRPGYGEFGLTVGPEGARAWLGDEGHSWAVGGGGQDGGGAARDRTRPGR
ncbi:methyltransferase domain-containing protein [Streptomyces sp. P6-2-1]|uniref:methyltransferase domain-containing protein n=1 Tax=unclassified Streptomyces TaxID=2593676 RepID=UPI003D365581